MRKSEKMTVTYVVQLIFGTITVISWDNFIDAGLKFDIVFFFALGVVFTILTVWMESFKWKRE